MAVKGARGMNDTGRRGLGRGLGALIPTAPPEEQYSPAAARQRGGAQRLLLDGNLPDGSSGQADGASRPDDVHDRTARR